MSIASAIAAAQQKVANAYTAVSNKGGTLPATQNLSNLPTAINSISGGTNTAGWISKTVSGTTVSEGTSLPDFTGINTIGKRAFYYAFYYNQLIPTTIDMSSITTISGDSGCYYMFAYATNITSVNLSNLTTISGSNACYWMFYGCSSLTSVNLNNLQTISGYTGCYLMFKYCNFTSFTFPKLSSIAAYQCLYRCFGYNSNLTSLSFPALKSTSFGSYTNQFYDMLQSCTGVTVHFPSNLQSVIGSWTDVQNGFGGTNTQVLFDLPATS